MICVSRKSQQVLRTQMRFTLVTLVVIKGNFWYALYFVETLQQTHIFIRYRLRSTDKFNIEMQIKYASFMGSLRSFVLKVLFVFLWRHASRKPLNKVLLMYKQIFNLFDVSSYLHCFLICMKQAQNLVLCLL